MDNLLSPIHPGEVLLEDFIKPLGLTQYRLAHDIGVTPIRVSQIVHGQRAISVDTAMRLRRYFGPVRSLVTVEFAMTLKLHRAN